MTSSTLASIDERPRLILALAAAFVLWGPSAIAQETSPGPLAQSHAKLESQCAKCHTATEGATDDKCLACHKVAKTSRFHWKMAQDSGKRCSSCHRDHRGREFAMVRWTPPKPFPHDPTGFALRGAHAVVACKACHKTTNRWMGEQQACGACHADKHKPSLGGRCQDCHGETHFAPTEHFDHARTKFKLTGKHATVACKHCHQGTGLAGRWRGIAFGQCADCHREPSAGHGGGRDCASCHGTGGWREVSRDGALQLHARTRMPLVGRHAEVACDKCHTPARGGPGERKAGLGPVDPTCTACHADPHERRMGNGCKQCHGFVQWGLNVAVGFDHARTGYRLDGRHRQVACTACHAPGPPYRKRFRSRDGDTCTDCHADPHGGPFASVAAGDHCETCHTVQGFTPARYGVTDHERTALPLTGAHRVTACSGCHVEVQGQPPRLHGTATICASCHKDPHGGQFRQQDAPVACNACHGVVAFLPATGFDHARTRFPLLGSHARVACTGCHFRAADGQPVQFTGLRGACAACHKDVHAGQFASSGPVRECGDCHGPEGTFKIAAFDHGRTRFALDGRHAKVACVQCHRRAPGPDGQPTVHYRLGPKTCAACHKNPHARGGGGS